MGVYAQILTMSNMVNFITSMGIPMGLVKYVSEMNEENKEMKMQALIFQTIFIALLVSIIVFFIFFIFSEYISVLIFGSNSYTLILIITAFSFPFAIIVSLLDAFARGLKQYSFYVKLSILLVLIGTIIPIIFVILFKETGAAIGITLTSIAGTITIIIYLFKNKYLKIISIRNFKNYDYTIIKNIFKLWASFLDCWSNGSTDLYFYQSINCQKSWI